MAPTIAGCAGLASVVIYRRTTDYALLEEILRIPEIYEWSGDDMSPPPEEFTLNRDSRAWYVLAEQEGAVIGLFGLFPENAVCFDLHLAMLPTAGTAAKWEAARDFMKWLWATTPCRRLTASVPRSNPRVRVYVTHGLGMRYVGLHERAFLKHGVLEDLLLYGKSKEVDA